MKWYERDEDVLARMARAIASKCVEPGGKPWGSTLTRGEFYAMAVRAAKRNPIPPDKLGPGWEPFQEEA